jgi:hypothetical protein
MASSGSRLPSRSIVLEYGPFGVALGQLQRLGHAKNAARDMIFAAAVRGGVPLQLWRGDRYGAPTEAELITFSIDEHAGEMTIVPDSSVVNLRISENGSIGLWSDERRHVSVEINLPALRAWVDRITPPSASNADVGGRPRKYDWDHAGLEAVVWIYHNGLPKPRACLVDYIESWFESECGHRPDRREIEKRVKSWISNIERSRPRQFGGDE